MMLAGNTSPESSLGFSPVQLSTSIVSSYRRGLQKRSQPNASPRADGATGPLLLEGVFPGKGARC
uniref:Uncharacterized protein n=1 Tax=Anguilla anguilla TaxID=7936 RepID=A0A0E9SEC0_ANGAN